MGPDTASLKGIFSPRWLIVALPVLAALGPYALPLDIAGINLFAFRMLILMMAAFSTPLTSGWSWWFNTLARRTMLLGGFWLFYGMISLMWTPDVPAGRSDLLSIGFGFALLLVLLNVRADESRNLDLLRVGWVLAFLITSAVAGWEITTGQHLQSFMLEEQPHYFDGSVIQSTLGRPENYGIFLLAATPFLIWSIYKARVMMKLIYAGMIGAAGVLVLFTASRLTFIGFAAELMVLLFILERRWYVMAFGLVAVLCAYFWWSSWLVSNELRIVSKLESAVSESEDNSINNRTALTLSGLWMVYDTGGRGLGAGGFPQATTDPDLPFKPDFKPEGSLAHNYWVQIASEYGIVPAAALAILLLFVARLALQATRGRRAGVSREAHVLGIVTILGLVGYLFHGVIGGSPLRLAIHWMYFASLMVIAAHLYKVRAPVARRQPLFQTGPAAARTSSRVRMARQPPS
jgi:hypothetical protein